MYIYIYIYIYIYVYIYIYINFKAINNVLDAKMVLKHITWEGGSGLVC